VNRISARGRRQGGQALVVLALVGMAMFGFGALALDQGVGMSDRRDLQAIADSAALAGSRSLPQGRDAANQVAIQYLARNLGLDPLGATGCAGALAGQCAAGSYTVGNYVFTVADGTGTMDVSVQHTRRTLVAGVLGINTAVTASGARAGSGAAPLGGPCVLCVLEPSAAGALQVTGSGSASVTGGNIVVDSTSALAMQLTGSGSISASGANLVVGGSRITGSGSIIPTAATGTAVADPLSALVAPTVAGSAVPYSLVGSSNATINPGVYSSISLIGSGSLTLNPGIYVLTGSMGVIGSGSISGTGVLLFFGCSSYPVACSAAGESGGSLQLTGSGSSTITAPSAATCTSIPATCAYVGLLVFYDRHNTAGMAITGSGSSGPIGTVYGASAPLVLTGSGGAVNSLIVVRTVTITGSGSIAVQFVGSQNYTNPQGASGLLR
jgi:Flp pilus assembly protein TadG